MTEPAAHNPQDQPPAAADGMIVCDRLVRIYSGEGIEVQALQGLDLLIAEGELTALIGAAGSGKSTLVNILAGLDTPTAGTAWVAGPYPAGAAGLRGGPGGGGGQRKDHGEPAAGGVFGFHGAAHRLGQAAGYREAEPDAGSVA